MSYMARIKQAAKVGAVTGLTAIVLATSGCATASSRGWKLTLGELEYGAKSTISKDPEIQKQVIKADAKYSESVDVAPDEDTPFLRAYKERNRQ